MKKTKKNKKTAIWIDEAGILDNLFRELYNDIELRNNDDERQDNLAKEYAKEFDDKA